MSAVPREATAKNGKVALTRVLMSHLAGVVALTPMGAELMAHTRPQERDLNSADQYSEGASDLKTEPDMIDLAVQLLNRQAAEYDPSDFEDRYEIRLRAMIDAMIARGALFAKPEEAPARGNVIDLVAALRKSLDDATTADRRPAVKTAPKEGVVTETARTLQSAIAVQKPASFASPKPVGGRRSA